MVRFLIGLQRSLILLGWRIGFGADSFILIWCQSQTQKRLLEFLLLLNLNGQVFVKSWYFCSNYSIPKRKVRSLLLQATSCISFVRGPRFNVMIVQAIKFHASHIISRQFWFWTNHRFFSSTTTLPCIVLTKTKRKPILNHVSQPASSQTDLAQSINHADCTLVLWQVLGARVRAFFIWWALVNGSMGSSANIEWCVLVVGDFVGVSRVTLASGDDSTGLMRQCQCTIPLYNTSNQC